MKKELVIFIIVITLTLMLGCSVNQSADRTPPEQPADSFAEENKDTGTFITANPLNLSQIQRISKFRSCVGHDYSGFNTEGEKETLRSMKHYIEPLTSLIGTNEIKIFAPFNGKIVEIRDSQPGTQLSLAADADPQWQFIFFHVDPVSGIEEGTIIKAGDQIGTASKDIHNFDIALKKFGWRQVFDSPFSHMDSLVQEEYETLGINEENIILPKQARDANPCPVDGSIKGDARFSSYRDGDFIMLKITEKTITETPNPPPKNTKIGTPSPVLPPPQVAESTTPEERVWRNRIEAAMAPTPCIEIPKPEYPKDYYWGPLTDTHLHIPSIPDSPPEEEDSLEDQAPEGRFGGPEALLGWNVKMSEIACTLKREGTHKNFAFFPVYEDIPSQLLEIWNRTMETYPDLFTPFIMSSGNDDDPNGFPTVDATTLQEMLAVYPHLFEGYGEIGLYDRENGGSPELPPDSARLRAIYPIVRKHGLAVYFHLGEGHKESFEKVLQQNPDINFIFHGDQLDSDDVEDLVKNNPNAYYGIDAFWGHDQDLFHLFVGKNKEEYLDALDAKFDTVLDYAVDDWKAIIERHPDRFIWGIDRGDAVWNYDQDVGKMQIKLARAFIGKLEYGAREKFAYKNAKRLMGGED